MTASFRKVQSGQIEGDCDERICRFMGVPYAAPPVGELRFQPPRPVEPWEGTRQARRPGPCAPHRIRPFPGLDIEPLVGKGGEEGGDYLTLNLWCPAASEKAPVMVFIHGGAYVLGSKDAAVHDGSAFAKSGVVYVAINYRLGVDGFLPIPGVPTNLGLRDMIAALHWVQANIAAFGGDPRNVTVFGESAGAMAIANLVTSPLAKGLFKRAIIQSGHGSMVRELSVAKKLVTKLAKILKIPATAEGFASATFDRTWKAMEKVSKPFPGIDLRDVQGFDPVYGISRFIPVYEDDVLPEHPLKALAGGAGKDVEVLIGTNSAEMNLYFVPTRVRAKIPGFLTKWLVGKSHPEAKQALKAYGLGDEGRKPGFVMTEALTDLVFRWPARQYATAHQGKTHVYEFDWHSPACDGELGAAHGVEVPFVFKTLESVSGPQGLVGENPPRDLADRVHRLWVGFATDGSLPWPEFDEDHRDVHLLGSGATISEPVMPAAAFVP